MRLPGLLSAATLVVVVGLAAPAAMADEALINLEWRPDSPMVNVGDPVALGLWAYTDPEELQLFRALDMVFTWDPAYLQLDDLDDTGAVELLSSGFPSDDLYGLNEFVPPQDGDGYYLAWAPLGEPIEVSPDGILLTTFEFTALSPTGGTLVDIAVSGGSPSLETTVWGGPNANTNVTGTLGETWVEIIPEPATLTLLALAGCTLLRRRRRLDATARRT